LHLEVYDALLEEGFTVSRVEVGEDTWLSGKQLDEVDLPSEGVLVPSIERPDGSRVGAPRGRYTVHAGDALVPYGKREKLTELKTRQSGRPGDAAHERKQDHPVRELLFNVVKHADADRATLRAWKREGGACRVAVHDDGTGFDVDEAMARPAEGAASTRTGLGLRETRERLRLLGGELGMTSSAERGTTAEISLPERAESPTPAAA
jgi:hypothetical protein